MLTLFELETYVNKHSHLPGIPSAETVSEEGINLGEMDGLLLPTKDAGLRLLISPLKSVKCCLFMTTQNLIPSFSTKKI